MSDPLAPPVTLLVKLGSLAIHVDEYLSPDGHPFDIVAIKQLLTDEEVMVWLKEMDRLAFIPKARK